ncbi:hypothetical protein V1286_007596 [Bradyrhizobium algeriense]|uniref:Uncharacterized protein n=1 Tax=Bradyrhizobium algeriense TaxID=634784 RepID=A0ABU8BNF1_9BRAD
MECFHRRTAADVSQRRSACLASIVVVLPPGNDAEATLAQVKRCFPQAWRRYVSSELASDQIERAFRVVSCIVSGSLEAASLVEIVRRAPSGSAFIITEAAAYRTPDGGTPSNSSALSEDFWVGHLHSLVALLQAAAEPSLAYVAVDAGEFLPDRPEHRDLLHTTRDGLLGIQDPARSCRAELLSDDYFHAVQEAVKSVAVKMRSRSGYPMTEQRWSTVY